MLRKIQGVRQGRFARRDALRRAWDCGGEEHLRRAVKILAVCSKKMTAKDEKMNLQNKEIMIG